MEQQISQAPPSTSTPSTPQPTDQPPPPPPPPPPQPSQQPLSPSTITSSLLPPPPNPNPTPKPQPPQSQSQTQSSSTQPSQLRPPFNRPWQPQSSSPFFPSITTHSPSPPPVPPFSSSASTSVPPAQRGGMAIGVPAHHAGPPPPPSSFSSLNPPSYGQQFGSLGRSSVSVPESVPSSSSSQMRQSIQGMQGMGMMGSLGSSSSLRPSGVPAHLQQRPAQSSLRPQTSQSNQSPAAQNFQGHGLLRGPSVGSPGSPSPSTSQSLQPHNQPWLSSGPQGKPPLPPPSFRPPMNPPSLQQRSHIAQQHAMSTPAQQQQTSSSPQPQQSSLSHQQSQEHYTLPPSRVPSSLPHQQQITRGQGLGNQKPSAQAFGQPSPAQPAPFNRTAASVETGESCSRILSKRSIQELVTQIDPSERLDPEVEDILVDIADEFVESVGHMKTLPLAMNKSSYLTADGSVSCMITTFGCSLAKHRKSNTLEAKDILLHLERNWNMTLPGFSGDEIKSYKKPFTNDIHRERLAAIRKSIVAAETATSKISAGQAGGSAKGHPAKAPANIIGSPNP